MNAIGSCIILFQISFLYETCLLLDGERKLGHSDQHLCFLFKMNTVVVDCVRVEIRYIVTEVVTV